VKSLPRQGQQRFLDRSMWLLHNLGLKLSFMQLHYRTVIQPNNTFHNYNPSAQTSFTTILIYSAPIKSGDETPTFIEKRKALLTGSSPSCRTIPNWD